MSHKGGIFKEMPGLQTTRWRSDCCHWRMTGLMLALTGPFWTRENFIIYLSHQLTGIARIKHLKMNLKKCAFSCAPCEF